MHRLTHSPLAWRVLLQCKHIIVGLNWLGTCWELVGSKLVIGVDLSTNGSGIVTWPVTRLSPNVSRDWLQLPVSLAG